MPGSSTCHFEREGLNPTRSASPLAAQTDREFFIALDTPSTALSAPGHALGLVSLGRIFHQVKGLVVEDCEVRRRTEAYFVGSFHVDPQAVRGWWCLKGSLAGLAERLVLRKSIALCFRPRADELTITHTQNLQLDFGLLAQI